MKGDPKVINALQIQLVSEATAIEQYRANLEVIRNWQYKKLAAYYKERLADEVKHHRLVSEQILFLGGTPVTGQLNPIQTGATVQQMLDFDHASELSAIRGYNASIAVCVEAGDEITGRILRRILKDEGNHIGDIEARQTQIDQLGSLGLYLATQIGG